MKGAYCSDPYSEQLLFYMLYHNVQDKKKYFKKNGKFEKLRKKMNLIFGPYCASALFMLHIQQFRVQNFNTFYIIPEKLKVLSWIVSEEFTGQNDLSKNDKLGHFPNRKDVSKCRLEILYYRTIPPIPENFMKIRPRVWEISVKKNNNNREKETEE